MNQISIVVVDDHPLFRQGVVNTLSLEPDLQVVGEAANGEKGLELIRAKRPDIAILDVNLPGMNGQQVTRMIAAEKLNTRVILLTAYDDTQQQLHAMHAGAAAYCTKDVLPEDLIQTIRQVAARDSGSDLQEIEFLGIDAAFDPSQHQYAGDEDAFQPLSAREMEVLSYVTRGLSNKEIASMLKISHQTVKNHVTAILRKLGVEDRTQAAIYALKRGWVRLYDQDSESQE
jgi:two-component system response regulator DegU